MTVTDITDPPPNTSKSQAGWTRTGAIAFIFLAALACFLPLPANSPLAGTEGHRAITAHQMVQTGEWLVPRMFGRVYLAKPPLHYWIVATFETISRHATPFIWRLPSAVEGAILAAVLCWLAYRWFGGIAGIVSGFSYIALITMWGQDRGADIDITNALFSTLAAICLLDMQFGPNKKRALWIVAGGLAIGASFLTKGPCGLPIILAAMMWIAIVRIRERQTAGLFKPAFWMPLAIGIVIFALYAFATYSYIRSHHMAADWTGVQEGTEDLHPHDWSIQRAMGWVLLPLVMFTYALPISLALPLSFLPQILNAQDRVGRARMMTLTCTLLLSWVVCFVSGMHLPRYAYVTLPLMCPLAGAVANLLPALRPQLRRSIAIIAGGSTLIFGLVVVALTCFLWRHPSNHAVILITALVALPLSVLGERAVLASQPNWRALLYTLPIILICLGINYGYVTNLDRLQRSSREQGNMIRSITGPDAHLVTCMMVLDQPELFYYSGLPTTAMNGDMLDWRKVKTNTWVVLEDPELDVWKREVPERLKRVIRFVANRNPGYLVWYSDSV
jgi:hypothetical protein